MLAEWHGRRARERDYCGISTTALVFSIIMIMLWEGMPCVNLMPRNHAQEFKRKYTRISSSRFGSGNIFCVSYYASTLTILVPINTFR